MVNVEAECFKNDVMRSPTCGINKQHIDSTIFGFAVRVRVRVNVTKKHTNELNNERFMDSY